MLAVEANHLKARSWQILATMAAMAMKKIRKIGGTQHTNINIDPKGC